MGLFNKIIDTLKGQEQSGQLDFKETEDLLQRELEKTEQELIGSCEQNLDEIQASAKEIQDITQKLREEEIPEDMAERLTRIAETSKPAFVKSVEEAIQPLSDIERPETFSELKAFQTKVEEVLESMGKAHTGQGRYLSMVYEEEVKEVKKESKNILYQNDALEDKIPEYEGKIADLNALIEKTRQTKNRKSNQKELVKEIEETENELENKKQVKNQKHSEKKEHEKSEGYEQLLSEKEKIEEIKEEKKKLENRVLNLLTPLKRPLKKYRRQAYIEEKETEVMVDDYIEKPVKRFFERKTGDLDALLENVRKTVEEDKIDFKDREKRKTLQKIDRVLDYGMQELRQRYRELEEKRTNLEKEIENSKARKKLQKIEKTISSLEKEIQRLKEKKEDLEKRRKNMEKEIQEGIQEIEQETNELTGKGIKVSS